MKKKQLFDDLRYADDDILGEMAELCRPLDKAADRRIYSKIKRKCRVEVCGDDTEDYVFEVKGVDVYMRPEWFKQVRAAVICLVFLGGIGAGSFLVKKLGSSDMNLGASSYQDDEKQDKVTINIAVVGTEAPFSGITSVYNAKSKMQKQNTDYDVNLVKYNFEPGENKGNTDELVNRLSMDMLAGNIPDIIIAPSYQLDKFRRQGYLTDLSPLMESGVGLRREDFLDSVINSVDENGKIDMIYPSFKLYTAVAETERVGDNMENWTVQQAMDAYRSCDGKLLSLMSKDCDINDYFFYGAMTDCIDFKMHTCDFNNGLVQTMDFLTDIPEFDWIIEEYEVDSIADHEGIVQMLEIDGINFKCAWSIVCFYENNPVTFVGYPTNSGSGSYTDIDLSFGIVSNSDNKETAWKALSQMFFSNEFLVELNKLNVGIPVTKKAVNKLLNQDEYAENTINKAVSVNKQVGLNEYEQVDLKISEEQKQQLYDYINRIKIDPFVNKNIEQIIKEESDYVFNGERTIDEFVNIIKSRIGLYMSETQ